MLLYFILWNTNCVLIMYVKKNINVNWYCASNQNVIAYVNMCVYICIYVFYLCCHWSSWTLDVLHCLTLYLIGLSQLSIIVYLFIIVIKSFNACTYKLSIMLLFIVLLNSVIFIYFCLLPFMVGIFRMCSFISVLFFFSFFNFFMVMFCVRAVFFWTIHCFIFPFILLFFFL